jgi:protein-tyrosine phosphatase
MLVRKTKAYQVESEPNEQFRCLFCRGHFCNRCGPTAYRQCENIALHELHSNWITDSILGMARPTNLNDILLQDFIEKGITAVFNLTMRGEHPYCGLKDGFLDSSGFSYNPERFMSRGIKHINFSWPDMTIPTLHQALQIVQISIAEIYRGGKIAVHCHAGYGRTGMIIACILIAKEGMAAEDVISYVRDRRPGSIQTSGQVGFVSLFERFYIQALNSYSTPALYVNPDIFISPKSIIESITDQDHTLLAFEKVDFRWIHKAIDITQKILVNSFPHHVEKTFFGITGHHLSELLVGQFENILDDDAHLATTTAVYSLKIQANKNDWSNWNGLLTRSYVAAIEMTEEEEILKNSLSKSEIHLNEIPTTNIDSVIPLRGRDIAVAAQLFVDWFADRSYALLRDEVLEQLAQHLQTLAAATLLGCFSNDGRGYWDLRDFSATRDSPDTASAMVSVENVLSKSLSKWVIYSQYTPTHQECYPGVIIHRYELHTLSRIVAIISIGHSSALDNCKTQDHGLLISGYISLRLAVMCTLAQREVPELLEQGVLSPLFLRIVSKFPERMDGSEGIDAIVIARALVARDVLNLLAACSWKPTQRPSPSRAVGRHVF